MTLPAARRSDSGAAFVLVATGLFAFKGILARLVLETGTSVVAVVSLRVLMATPLYVGVALLLLRRKPLPPSTARARLEALLTGAFFLLAAACDFSAIDRIGAGPSRVILFSFPGFVLLIEAVRTRAWPRPVELLTFAVAWVGLVGVAAPEGPAALAGRDKSGVLFALGGAVAYAIFLTASQRSHSYCATSLRLCLKVRLRFHSQVALAASRNEGTRATYGFHSSIRTSTCTTLASITKPSTPPTANSTTSRRRVMQPTSAHATFCGSVCG